MDPYLQFCGPYPSVRVHDSSKREAGGRKRETMDDI